MEPAAHYHIREINEVGQRVQLAFAAVTEGIASPECLVIADEVVGSCAGHDWRCEVEHIYLFVQALAEYRSDPEGMDLYKTLLWVARTRSADCSSFTIALLTLLALKGYGVGVSVIDQQYDWDHIYALIAAPPVRPETRLSLDATKRNGFPGFEQPAMRWFARRDYWYDAAVWMQWWQEDHDPERMPAVAPTNITFRRQL